MFKTPKELIEAFPGEGLKYVLVEKAMLNVAFNGFAADEFSIINFTNADVTSAYCKNTNIIKSLLACNGRMPRGATRKHLEHKLVKIKNAALAMNRVASERKQT